MMTTKMRMTTISEPVIRKGSIKDLEGIAEVEERAFGIRAYDYPSLKYMLKKVNAITIVSEIEGKIVGYGTVYFGKKSRTAHMESIAVDPAKQRNGLGKMLLLELERISRETGYDKMILETFENNSTARNFYGRNGYLMKQIVVDYYHIPYEGSRNAVRFYKLLNTK